MKQVFRIRIQIQAGQNLSPKEGKTKKFHFSNVLCKTKKFYVSNVLWSMEASPESWMYFAGVPEPLWRMLVKNICFYINNHCLDPDRVNPKHSVYQVTDSQRIWIHMANVCKTKWSYSYSISYLTEDERDLDFDFVIPQIRGDLLIQLWKTWNRHCGVQIILWYRLHLRMSLSSLNKYLERIS